MATSVCPPYMPNELLLVHDMDENTINITMGSRGHQNNFKTTAQTHCLNVIKSNFCILILHLQSITIVGGIHFSKGTDDNQSRKQHSHHN